MRLDDALEQLSAIHEQVLRSETFDGYRAVPAAATGLLALAAALVQQVWLPAADAAGFARYWVMVAFAAGLVFAVDLGHHALSSGPGAGRRTALALRQLLPALLVGGLITAALVETEVAGLLPGIWALCFALGVVASRPFLPVGIGWVAGFYLASGALLLMLPSLRGPQQASLGMGLVFGIGQLGAAFALRRAEEVRRGPR
jgi:hypothetical protein